MSRSCPRRDLVNQADPSCHQNRGGRRGNNPVPTTDEFASEQPLAGSFCLLARGSAVGILGGGRMGGQVSPVRRRICKRTCSAFPALPQNPPSAETKTRVGIPHAEPMRVLMDTRGPGLRSHANDKPGGCAQRDARKSFAVAGIQDVSVQHGHGAG